MSFLFKSIITIFFTTTAAFTQIKVACIGNSITSGYQSTGVSYVPKLQVLLGTGYTVQNDGVSGTTLLKNGDNSYWKNGLLSQALAFKANIITIKLGTNDTKSYNWDVHSAEFRPDYEALIDTLSRSTPKPKIYLVLPVPVFYNASTVSWGIRDSIIKKMIPIIKDIAAARGLSVIDANTPLLPFAKYFSVDGIHPNAQAADTIAHVIYRSIIPTSVSPTVTMVSFRKAGGFTHVYPLFGGCNIPSLFADIHQGCRYELSIFTTSGSLVSRTSIDASSASQSAIRNVASNTPVMQWAVLNKQIK
jgi:acyl-CoA thioesterase I